MMHDIDVLGCGVIYIDGIRVFGSKPYGLFSTVTWKASDEDLKRISDRCLEVVAEQGEPNCSEKPNNCKVSEIPTGSETQTETSTNDEKLQSGVELKQTEQTDCPWK